MEYRIGVKDVIIFVFLMVLFAGPVLAGIDTVTDRINVNFLRLYSGSNFNITDTGGNLLLLFDGASWVLYDNGAVTANFSYSNTTLNTTVLSLLNTDIAMRDNKWIGLGGAAGRIEFDDLATDEINILSAKVRIASALNVTNLLNVQGYVRIPLDTGLSAVALILGSDDATKGGIRFEGTDGATVPANSNRTIDIYGASKLILGDSNDDVSLSADSVFIESSTGYLGVKTVTPSTFELEVAGSIGPSANNTYDLGSNTRRFNEAWIVTLYQGHLAEYWLPKDGYDFSIGDVVAQDTNESGKCSGNTLDACGRIIYAVNKADRIVGVVADLPRWINTTANVSGNVSVTQEWWPFYGVAIYGKFAPVRVVGLVKAGDILVASGTPGVATSMYNTPHPLLPSQMPASTNPNIYNLYAELLPSLGVAIQDYDNASVGTIAVNIKKP